MNESQITRQYNTIYFSFLDQDKVSEYSLKLMEIDGEHLGIPVSWYFNVELILEFWNLLNVISLS